MNQLKELIIIGASGFGREVLQWVKEINQVKETWIIKGFLDDNLSALDGYECDHKIIGTIKDWQPAKNEAFTCALAKPKLKEQIVAQMKKKGAQFEQIIHPTARIGSFNQIGEGVILCPRASLTVNIKIGVFVTILRAGVGHDANIGDYTTISSNCLISGHVHTGKRVFIGSNAVIIPSKRIGDDALVGAGSVVVSNVKPGITVMGNPAKKLF